MGVFCLSVGTVVSLCCNMSRLVGNVPSSRSAVALLETDAGKTCLGRLPTPARRQPAPGGELPCVAGTFITCPLCGTTQTS